MEEEAEQTVVTYQSDDMGVDMDMAQTPHPGPSWCTDATMSVMTILHTPLLGPTDMQLSLAGPVVRTNSGAGVNANKSCQKDNCIQSSLNIPDMRKAVGSHSSPKLSINFDKSPTVVGGVQEHFVNILDMITYWRIWKKGREGGKRIQSRWTEEGG